jgi:N-acetylglucosaminyldiphosphoundecaprenol N-acetyl-beta-D-mannosaminyltransferase
LPTAFGFGEIMQPAPLSPTATHTHVSSSTLPRSALPAATVSLLGHRFHALTEAQTLTTIIDALSRGEGGWVVTANLDHLRRLRSDPDYAALCRQSSLVVADGMPLIWAAALQGTPLPERVAGSSMIDTLSAKAGEAGRSIFLLGGAPGTAETAARILQQRYAGLHVAGMHCPPPGFEQDPSEWQAITDKLQQARPDIVFVALGSPKQERLIERMRPMLPETWWLGVGVSFSFVAGHVHRAPPWMQRLGLEWVHRLAQEPRRLARRYLVEGVPFAVELLVRSALSRWRPKSGDTG